MGFTSILLQVTILRQLLATFSGNELDIGITLSFWLIYVGLGSYTGKRFKSTLAFVFSFICIALTALPTIIAIKAIRLILSLEPGEIVPFGSTIFTTGIFLFPLCFFIGLQFPFAVSFIKLHNAAGRVYGLESIGSFIGGILFTFLIATRMDAMEICLAVSLLNIFMALYISGKKSIILVCIIPLLVFFVFQKRVLTLPWGSLNVIQTVQSKYGEITIIQFDEQTSIYSNGHLHFTYPNVPVEEIKVHLPVTLHPSPEKVLVIGGSIGTIREFLKYPIKSIEFIEIDPAIIRASFALLSPHDGEAIKDRKVRIIHEDGRSFIKKSQDSMYDLIILNLPQPTTANINRFYTLDFFKEVSATLRKDGILALGISQSSGYMGRSMQAANSSIYNSLRSVFPHVVTTTQEYGTLFASESPIKISPVILETRFSENFVPTQYFHQYVFYDAFAPLGIEYVTERLRETPFINTDMKPTAYLYNLLLWAEIQKSNFLNYLIKIKAWHALAALITLLILLSILIVKDKKRIIHYSIFTTGFTGMSFFIALILTYQAMHGYLYEMIGLLTAIFMIGIWSGTAITSRIAAPLRYLFSLELVSVFVFIGSIFLIQSEHFFSVLIFISGALTGAQFSAANLSMGKIEAAGNLYAFDLFGSFLGSFISAIILIPLFGIASVLFSIALIKAVSALMIFSIRHLFFLKEDL
jgi:spermidine synthase